MPDFDQTPALPTEAEYPLSTHALLANFIGDSSLDLLAGSTSAGTGAQWDGSINAINSGASLIFNQTGPGVADR